MKKIVFALQVFGMLALFPIYIVVEMNHGTASFPGTKNRPVVIEKTEKINTPLFLNAVAQIESAVPVTMITASRPPVSMNEIIKALFKAY
jgi:hypothetical protein